MSNKSKEVVIVSAIRTPIGKYRGSLKNIRSDQLGSIVIKEVLKKYFFLVLLFLVKCHKFYFLQKLNHWAI